MKLLLKKLFPKPNGNDNESVAIKSYVDYYSKMGKSVVVNSHGLSVHPSTPWLAASPDGIIYI